MNDSSEICHEIDIYVGEKLRQRRKILNLSQSALGEMVALSLQQIQKYEQGTNRIAASKLYEFAQVLRVPITYFYDGIELLDSQQKEREDGKIHPQRSKPINIMLVEDNAADEVLTRKAIEASGIRNEIHSAHDGVEALHQLRGKSAYNHKPDIVLLDINLPKLDGLSVLKEMKRDSQLKEIPVIVITNSINRKDMVDSYKAGASGFLYKSFDVDEFNRNISSTVHYWSESVVLPSM